jgi:hypothetical protein
MVTVVHNGQTIHENQAIPGPTGGGESGNVARAPIKFQDHGNPVRFRNIWVVEQTLPDGLTIPKPVVQMPATTTVAPKAAAGKPAATSTRRIAANSIEDNYESCNSKNLSRRCAHRLW